ncbi:MAG: GerMN domain-containing protein [Anaerobutyricum sp.]|nr:GerMN domain-containing protein [Anaerobutyricum sp.]
MRKKVCSIILCIIFAVMTLNGCGGHPGKKEFAKVSEKMSKDGTIMLYFLNAKEDGFQKVPYTLENREDPLSASNEVIYRLSDTENNNTDQYKASIFNGISVNQITLEGNEENIDFGAGYSQLDNVKEALLRTSIVKSLLQIRGVDSVTFSVNGSSLLGRDKMPVGVMDADTILTEKDEKDIYTEKKRVKLYYSNKKGNKLIPVERVLTARENVPFETEVLMALKNPPKSRKNLKSPLPEDFQVNQTQILNNVCYVDLDSSIENAAVDVKENVTVYAMVNSLTELDRAYQVQFTIDGNTVSKLNEFKHFDALLTSDFSLCK